MVKGEVLMAVTAKMHMTRGRVGQLSYFFVGFNLFQKNVNFFWELNYDLIVKLQKEMNKNAMCRNRTHLECTPVGDSQTLLYYVRYTEVFMESPASSLAFQAKMSCFWVGLFAQGCSGGS